GLLISPGAIAFLLTREFLHMLNVAVVVKLVAMLGGVYASVWLDSAPAPTNILRLTLAVVGAFVWRLWQRRRRVAVTC
ncbi:metal ABC transporter permease, partial [Marinovum sp. 1_MG-2023]|uniref:metal ABC transporter permease n=1 Tax=Marinovum sp. 1_MG-2023 TaxID=3062633 RepID=UPI0026E22066